MKMLKLTDAQALQQLNTSCETCVETYHVHRRAGYNPSESLRMTLQHQRALCPCTPKSTPDERNLAEIITVLKANITSPRVLLNPDTCFTKGQMAYLIEVLENYCGDEFLHNKTTNQGERLRLS